MGTCNQYRLITHEAPVLVEMTYLQSWHCTRILKPWACRRQPCTCTRILKCAPVCTCSSLLPQTSTLDGSCWSVEQQNSPRSVQDWEVFGLGGLVASDCCSQRCLRLFGDLSSAGTKSRKARTSLSPILAKVQPLGNSSRWQSYTLTNVPLVTVHRGRWNNSSTGSQRHHFFKVEPGECWQHAPAPMQERQQHPPRSTNRKLRNIRTVLVLSKRGAERCYLLPLSCCPLSMTCFFGV